MGHKVAVHLLGVDEMGHAEFLGQGFLARVGVNPDNHVGPDHAAALDDVEADAAEAEDDDVGARFHFGRVDDGANTGGDAAADVAHLVERRVGADLGQGNLRHHGEIGEGRGAHIVVDGFAAQAEPAGAVGHQALALGDANGLAQVGLAAQAIFALAALGRVQRDDVIAGLQAGDAVAHLDHHAGAFMAEDGGEDPFRVVARQGESVGMANSRRLDFDQHFAGLGPVQVDGFDAEGISGLVGNGCADFHVSPSLRFCADELAADVITRYSLASRSCATHEMKRLVGQGLLWAKALAGTNSKESVPGGCQYSSRVAVPRLWKYSMSSAYQPGVDIGTVTFGENWS